MKKTFLLSSVLGISAILTASMPVSALANGRIYYGILGDISLSNTSYSVNSDGTNNVQESGDWTAYDTRWSPNGLKVAYSIELADGFSDVVVSNPDGSARTVVAAHVPVNNNGGRLSWSPDSTKVAYGLASVSGGVLVGYPYTVGYAAANGSGAASLASRVSVPLSQGFFGLTWTSNSKISYVKMSQLCNVVINKKTKPTCTNLPLISPAGWASYLNPQASPDGKKLLVTGVHTYIDNTLNQAREWQDVYIANIDGSGMTNLTNMPVVTSISQTNSGSATANAWSPDGSKVLYLQSGTAVDQGLFTINADGTSAFKVGTVSMPYAADWAPAL